jgi:hypothetical protein
LNEEKENFESILCLMLGYLFVYPNPLSTFALPNQRLFC